MGQKRMYSVDHSFSTYIVVWFFFQGQQSPYIRPWQSPVPELQKSIVEKIPFPSDDEETGMVLIGYRGPKATVCSFSRFWPNQAFIILFWSGEDVLIGKKLVVLCIFSPLFFQDNYSIEAVKVILTYLTDSPVATLQQILVENPDPFCSDVCSCVCFLKRKMV